MRGKLFKKNLPRTCYFKELAKRQEITDSLRKNFLFLLV